MVRFLLHISSSWVKIRWHTKNQSPRLYESSLKVCLVGQQGVVQLNTMSLPACVEVELCCAIFDFLEIFKVGVRLGGWLAGWLSDY